MRVVKGNEAPPKSVLRGAVAIGNFDGAHRGHQVLFEETRATAAKLGAQAGAIVFEPHPREYFTPDAPHFRLTPLPEKLRLLEAYGLDFTVVLDFDERLASLSAEEFIEVELVGRLGVRHVVVGYDFLFGHGRKGTTQTLRRDGERLGFGVSVIRAQGTDGVEVFSSSAIRAALSRGDVEAAAHVLGHWWRVIGTVQPGAQIGSSLGFPTANIPLLRGTALAHGVYAVQVFVEGSRLDGAAYYGSRPTVDNGAPLLEVTLFSYEGDLYGKTLSVAFVGFIRVDETFESLESMSVQIEKDCVRAREILATTGPVTEPK